MKRALGVLLLIAVGVGAWLWLRTDSGPRGPDITERSAQDSHQPAPRLSRRVIASEDLPPAGTRSLFDHLVAQNDGLPYPFEKLVEMLQKQDPEGRAPVTLMIPQGRSLLKAQADFHHPRVLVAADFQAAGTPASLGLSPRGQLFLGFVENAGEIEVLSYNEAAGRFEFQLVQDYTATGARRIVYARRAVCTTCHQGGTPIFPQRPWAETNGQPEIAAQILAARGAQPYLGMPAAQPLASPERFDELTDTGAFVAVTQQLWIDGCGAEGQDCRRLTLKLALRYLSDPGSFDAQGADAAQLRQMQAKAWPPEGIAVPESDLRNRDPLAERRGLRNRIRAFFTPPPKPGEGARNNDDLVAFDRLPKLPATLDPLTPRPPKRLLSATDIDGVYGLAALFSEADRARLEQAGGIAPQQLEQAVDRLDAAQFKAAPFSRVKTLQALLSALGEKAVPAYCCLETAEMSPPQASGGPPLKLAANSPLLPFEQYCFTCHRGNPAKRLDFMGGRNEAEVLEQVKATAKIRDALDWDRYRGTDKEHTLMPPPDSAQRAELEAALKKDPKLLERMRETVPGLFDF